MHTMPNEVSGGQLTAAKLIELTEKYIMETYNPLPVVLVRGKGPWVWDIEGRKYLDMLSCYSALSHGHCHPRILKVLTQQAKTLANISRAFYNDQMGLFCKELAEFAGFPKVLPMNTGAEAIEKAIKIVRKWGYTVKGIARNRSKIIVCENNFHGRTITIISFSSEPLYKEDFGPHTPGFEIIPYGDLQALKNAIDENTVGFLVEPVQGEGGVIIPPEGYLKGAKEICQKNNVLFMLDEIQTGLGRCGKRFAYEYEDAKPDVLTLGKALGAGPCIISAVLCGEKVGDVLKPGEDGSTFSGSPLSCAVAREGLKVLIEEGLVENSYELGNYFMAKLQEIETPFVKDIRGKGLFIALEIKPEHGDARFLCEKLWKEGLLCKETHFTNIRLAPPLIIKKGEIDWAIKRIKKVLQAPQD